MVKEIILKSLKVKNFKGIDEVNSSIKELDFNDLDIQRREVSESIKQIDEQLQDKSKANEGLVELKRVLLNKEHSLAELEYQFKSNTNRPRQALESNIRSTESNIRHSNWDLRGDIERLQNRLDNVLVPKRNNLVQVYKDIKNSNFEFDVENCKCPMCDRKFETEDIEKKRMELEVKFNSEKAKKLDKNIRHEYRRIS